MERSLRFWLLFMMTPFFIGMLILFIVPLQFIINLSPRLEQSYNANRIEVQQNIVRAIAYLNSRVVNNHLQIYQNVRISLTRLLDRSQQYQSINLQSVSLNSGAQITQQYLMTNNISSNTIDYNKSMWFIDGVDQLSQMDTLQQFIYRQYVQVQPYIRAYFQRFSPRLISLQTYISYQSTQVYFRYPSESLTPQQQKQENQTTASFPIYLDNLNNYYQSGNISQEIIYAEKDMLKTCTLVFTSGEPFGTICLQINILSLIQEISDSLENVQYDQSTNQFYLLKPIYGISQDQENPQIIAFFGNNNSQSGIYIPQTPEYFNTTKNSMNATLFHSTSSQNNYKMNIKRVDRTQTFYTLPIYNYNYEEAEQISMFLVVMNNFEKANLHDSQNQKQILLSITIPSIVLLILAITVSSFIMRRLIKQLNGYLEKLNEFCGLILKDDFGLEIPMYQGTCDFEDLFQNLEILNKLNKYTEPAYFKGQNNEKLIQYLGCAQFFQDLGYNKAGIFQCLGDCYAIQGDLKLAIMYMERAIQISEDSLKKNFGTIEEIYLKKIIKEWKPTRKEKQRQKILGRKVLKICDYLSKQRAPGDTKNGKKLSDYVQKLMKLSYPKIFHYQYIYATIIEMMEKIKDGDFNSVGNSLPLLYGLLEDYGVMFDERDPEWKIPTDILMSYFKFLQGCWEMSRNNYLQAYESFVKGLSSNFFKPQVHGLIIQKLQKLLYMHKINPNCLKRFHFYTQYQPTKNRKYIFLMDVSNPNTPSKQMKKWKTQAKKMLSHIYEAHIQSTDEIFIYEFCRQTKVICEMVKKQKQTQMVKKQLLSTVKFRQQIVYSQMIASLDKIISRTKSLKEQKIYIIFMKNGSLMNGYRIKQVIGDNEGKFLFFYHDTTSPINQANQSFYLINMQANIDVDRVLGDKQFKEAKKSPYIFE